MAPNLNFCLFLMTSLNTQRVYDNTAVKVQEDPITLEITPYYSNKTMLNCFSFSFYIRKKYFKFSVLENTTPATKYMVVKILAFQYLARIQK